MNGTLIKIILLASIFLAPLSLDAMVSYHLIKTPNEEHLLILGDRHTLNKPFLAKHFTTFLQSIVDSPLSQPLPFIVEYDEDIQDDTTLQSSTIAQVLQLKKTNNPSLNIIGYEPRKIESDYLEDLFGFLAQVITTGVPFDVLKGHYNINSVCASLGNSAHREQDSSLDWQETFTKLGQNNRVQESPVTIEEYQTYLNSNLKKITHLLEKYADNPIMLNIINEGISTYEKGIEQINELFKMYPPKNSLAVGLLTVFSNCATDNEVLSCFDYTDRILRRETDFVFADLLFLEKVVDTLASEKCVCLLVGYDHAKQLAQYFELLNSTILSTKNGYHLQLPLLSGFDYETLETLITPELTKQFLEPLTKKSCATCNATQALKKCSRCKKVWYCSKQCQLNNWNSHKIICKKID